MPAVVDLPDVVERRIHGVIALARLGDHRRVVRPASLVLAELVGELPVVVRRVVAQHVAGAAPVEQRRGAPDDVEVDVDRLRDGIADRDGPAPIP